jgi:hypothetical protein
MCEPKVYRPRYDRGGCVLFIGTCFAIFGLLGLYVVGWESWYFYGLFFAIGILGIGGGFALLRSRVVVDEDGISKLPRWAGGGFMASWDAIETWLVTPCYAADKQRVWSKLYAGKPPRLMPLDLLNEDDSFTFQAAIFKLRGKRWPIVVYDCEARWPSFAAFVEDIRDHAREKEVTVDDSRGT